MRKITLLSLLLTLCTGAWAEPSYKSADFSGGLNQLQLANRTRLTQVGYDHTLFNCFTCGDNATQVFGHLIFDSSLPTVGATNPFNVRLSAIDDVPYSAIFELNVGPMQFHFGDAGIPAGGEPAIQYLNGVYNGLIFAEDFLSPNGTPLRFRSQGPTFDVRRLSDNTILFTGRFLNPGALTNIQDFDPASVIPEPESYALLLAGLGLLGIAARRRTRSRLGRQP